MSKRQVRTLLILKMFIIIHYLVKTFSFKMQLYNNFSACKINWIPQMIPYININCINIISCNGYIVRVIKDFTSKIKITISLTSRNNSQQRRLLITNKLILNNIRVDIKITNVTQIMPYWIALDN